MEDKDTARILSIDDSPVDVELVLHGLKKHNLSEKVHVSKDGAEAMDLLFDGSQDCKLMDEDKPELILLDLKLPKINSLEILKRIKTDKRTKTIPVVVMTSSDEEKDMVESYELGANSYVTKPVNFNSFMDIIAKLGFYWVSLNRTP